MSTSGLWRAGTVLCLLLSGRCWASLGGDTNSVHIDSQQFNATHSSVSAQQYDIHTISVGTNSVIREYVANGQVFAVTWQSGGMPNLRQLLGSYFDGYVATAKATHRPGSQNHLTVTRNDVVVQSSGRSRSFHGKAYLPSLMPAGVTPNDLN